MEYRKIVILGRVLYVGLENVFWDCLEDIATASSLTADTLFARVGEQHPDSVESALRVFALSYVLALTSGSELTLNPSACERASKYH
jgi:predicted DNA-binding ribbon-helix-helix protein